MDELLNNHGINQDQINLIKTTIGNYSVHPLIRYSRMGITLKDFYCEFYKMAADNLLGDILLRVVWNEVITHLNFNGTQGFTILRSRNVEDHQIGGCYAFTHNEQNDNYNIEVLVWDAKKKILWRHFTNYIQQEMGVSESSINKLMLRLPEMM